MRVILLIIPLNLIFWKILEPDFQNILTQYNIIILEHRDYRLSFKEIDKLKNFTYYPCSIINIGINTNENNSCPRGEIGRHKGLKKYSNLRFH